MAARPFTSFHAAARTASNKFCSCGCGFEIAVAAVAMVGSLVRPAAHVDRPPNRPANIWAGVVARDVRADANQRTT
jgi:hypothetical protein